MTKKPSLSKSSERSHAASQESVEEKSLSDNHRTETQVTAETFEVELERRLEGVLSNLPRVQREQVISTVAKVTMAEAYSGPLPHPRHLRDYEITLPGTADRILVMTERMMDHNILSLERQQTWDHRYRLLGMWLGFFAFLLLAGMAVVAGFYGHVAVAGILMGTTALGTIGVFLRAHYNNK